MLTGSVSAASLEKGMAATWQRMQLIANNITNEETPGYKAKRLEFESILSRELQNSNLRITAQGTQSRVERVGAVTPRVYEDNSTIGRADGNNVQIDNEEIELARVQIQYQALQQKLSAHYNLIKYAITGG